MNQPREGAMHHPACGLFGKRLLYAGFQALPCQQEQAGPACIPTGDPTSLYPFRFAKSVPTPSDASENRRPLGDRRTLRLWVSLDYLSETSNDGSGVEERREAGREAHVLLFSVAFFIVIFSFHCLFLLTLYLMSGTGLFLSRCQLHVSCLSRFRCHSVPLSARGARGCWHSLLLSFLDIVLPSDIIFDEWHWFVSTTLPASRVVAITFPLPHWPIERAVCAMYCIEFSI